MINLEGFAWYLVFIGRPNAGKSSLISKLTYVNPKVGKKPGSTRRINEYTLAKKFKVVDVPGWGKVHDRTKQYEEKVKQEIVDFFEINHYRIAACVQVIDVKSLIDVSERLSKKGIIPIDQELFNFLLSLKLQPIVAFNKIDKVSYQELEEAVKYFKELVNYTSLPDILQAGFIQVSAKNNTNLGILRDLIRKHLRKNDVEEFERFIKVTK